ncbi:MAG: response regulator transcription factor [Acidimicrobiales bacterium]
MRLAQGQADVAQAAIQRALDEARSPSARAKLLPAHAEIMLANHAIEAARTAADELLEVARHFDAPFLRAVAAHANGAVLLAEGQVNAALEALRDAWSAWEQIDAPYEAARTRVLVGVACAQLDDKDSGSMEWDAARVVFQAVGAVPDLAALDAETGRGPSATHGLTPREVEVLRLVASGGTNRAIAETLFLSERTVDRHVSNLFNKLGVSPRSAATAFAYEHDLV